MAELADAHGSGPCERKFLQVQVLLSAPVRNIVLYVMLFCNDKHGIFVVYKIFIYTYYAKIIVRY